MSTTRRDFLSYGCSAAIAAMSGSRILQMAFAPLAAVPGDQILVVVFLRGGIDGLHFLGPADDKDYVAARPTALRVNESGDHAGLAIKNGPATLDFRLHKAAAPLKELYDGGDLAFIHACGLTNATRSHFEAMDYVERGVGGQTGRSVLNGWVTRLVEQYPAGSQLRAISATDRTPDSMLGLAGGVAMTNPEAFNTPGDPKIEKYLRRLYAGNTPVHQAGATTLATISKVQAKLKGANGQWIPYVPGNGVQYPEGELGNSLKTVARMIRADLGLQVATVDFGGWDTHEGQVYKFGPLVEHMSRSLAAFMNDLNGYRNRLNVVVISEFGRRLRANQSAGTDHGHGNVMMVLGGGVAGGKVFGRWPGLANEQLDQNADLAITTDYRTVLAELMTKRLGVKDVAAVLPGYGSGTPLGVFR